MKKYICIIAIVTLSSFGLLDFGDETNPLFGKMFWEIKEIPELKDFVEIGGAVIDLDAEFANYRFTVTQYMNDKKNICVFSELIMEEDKNADKEKPKDAPKVKYRILDTINVGEIKEKQLLFFCNCSKNKELDTEIIAIVKDEKENNSYNQVVKAWRANIKTGIIETIPPKGITCTYE